MKFGKTGILGLCLLGALALCLALVSPALFTSNGKPPSQPPAPGEQRWPLAAKGVVESEQDVEIASKVEGQLVEILVDEGDPVQTGQLLARLERSKIDARTAATEAALRQATAKRSEAVSGSRREDIAAAQHALNRTTAINDEARRNFERQERLFSRGAVTRVTRDRAEEAWQIAQGDFNEARARLDKERKGSRSEEIAAARAEEDRLRAELNYSKALANDYEITSPIDGVVINRFRNAYETVEVGTPILMLINPDKLQIWAELEETDAGLVAVGQNVIVTVDAYPGKEYKGKVTKVYAAVQRKSQRTFDPVASFDINTQKLLVALDEYQGLVHGMSVTVRFLK